MEFGTKPCCEFCGRPECGQMGDHWICDECYVERGACCADAQTDDDAAAGACKS